MASVWRVAEVWQRCSEDAAKAWHACGVWRTCGKGSWCQQYFRLKPQDTSVVVGRTAELHCHVGNRVGLVQWSKDGFLLGYDPDIPGYERYEMLVDPTQSEYTLFVHNAKLEDEGDFQCQVGPSKNEKPIRSVARLTVLVPPKSLLINELPDGSDVVVREGEKVVLVCQALTSKPATILKWYRKNVELMPEASRTSVRRETEKLYTTVSSITLYPKGDSSGVSYTCEALQPALEKTLKTSVSVQVLFPPSLPDIEGYEEGELLQAGDHLTITCLSKGGKPPARLTWYRNGEALDGSYFAVSREATSTISFEVLPRDNNAIYSCAAVNPLTPQPLIKNVVLSVVFPPTKVFMEGPSEARRGETVTVNCRSDVSNPPAEIHWLLDGEIIQTAETKAIELEGGSWFSSSNVSATITRQDTNLKIFSCTAIGIPRRKQITKTLNITIIYPPDKPTISDYRDGHALRVGQLQQFTCSTNSGQPTADLRWYRGKYEEPARVTLQSGRLHSNLHLQMNSSDNGILLRCEVNNSATIEPLFAQVKLKVLFPPKNVTITVTPNEPQEGDEVQIECWTGSSNPVSRITWWKQGEKLQGIQVRTLESYYEGLATGSTLNILSVSVADDGSLVKCEAKNDAFKETVEEQVRVRVRYAPKFIGFDKVLELVEGHSGSFNGTVRAYPEVTRFYWSKNGAQVTAKSENIAYHTRVISEGPSLYFRKVSKLDAGKYKCIAENAVGSANATMVLNVLYPASVFNITGSTEVGEGGMVNLECWANGNPIKEDTILWRRGDSGRPLPSSVPKLGLSLLTFSNISRSDAGLLECVAHNGIGKPSVSSVTLVVMYRPYVLRDSLKRYVAIGGRKVVELMCGANGHPEVSFTWSHNGTLIPTAQSNKYETRFTERKPQEFWSKLIIRNLEPTDVGEYTCMVKNYLGYDFTVFTVAKTGIPDRPEKFEVRNLTHKSVDLSWKPGFDGGLPQSFRIRFRNIKDQNYTYADAPSDADSFRIRDLRQGSIYEFAIAAKNKLGESAFTPAIQIQTKNLPVMDSSASLMDTLESSDDENLSFWLVTGAAIGSLILVVNILFCVVYVRHKNLCIRHPGAAQPHTTVGLEEVSSEKITKIPCNIEEESSPFYLSGTRVDISDDGLDLSSFQKAPSLKQISAETGEEGQSPRRKCDCSGRQWGTTLICGSNSPEPDTGIVKQHEQCPDLLKPDSCHFHTQAVQKTPQVETRTTLGAVMYGPYLAEEVPIYLPDSSNSTPRRRALTTFQPTSETVVSSLIGPKLETVINGHGEDS